MSSQALYDIEVQDIKGQSRTLDEYQGKVLLIVNTASKCGFTPQFEGLQKLHQELGGKGFVLGFPCNQFMSQDPGDNDEISQFCSLNYGVDFPMFAKIEVNGPNTHPLYRFLKSEAKGLMGSEKIKWNFTKFLVDQNGKVVKRYPPTAKPEAIRKDIEQLL
ncbi:glutathione peroxidase [Marinobacter nanhaiticus D15-8W]|uniref:Glutathione peroxidase n=1 Tax=Marinobacter nanhaiticus D15-8W TaxID=626887 RepID=N6WRU0_9GAMM|nr:glutathione peroxidase [Marinobacter nanhaiticus]ENO13722.1 glutathione peroxidase [Marinobacter nanhaiticus D15-8W]BES71095.1 glutathione peroxidase [Marinobacter nanhaiticus D15-8W]